MKKHTGLIILIATLILAIAVLSWLKGEFISSPSRGNYVSGWLTYFSFDQSFSSFKNNADFFSEVNPFIYAFAKDSLIIMAPGFNEIRLKNITNFARNKNIKVIPTVVNDVIDQETGFALSLKDPVIIHTALAGQTATNRHIENIISLVEKNDFDGIEIDYENIAREDAAQFTEFIRLLSSAMHSRGKTLNIVLEPKFFSGLRPVLNNQELSLIAASCDTVKLMCYNMHGLFSKPGPVATPGWIKQLLRAAERTIPKQKLCAAFALHGFAWKADKAVSLTYKEIQVLIEEYKPEILRDNNSVPYFKYIEANKTVVVWFEDATSIAAKVKIVHAEGFKKIAFWRLGEEDQNLYSNPAVSSLLR